MPDYKGIIALDLDGTLLNSAKELTPGNRAALERAARAGWLVVPTTGRFYNGMPQVIRDLPFVHYAITVNGAEVLEIATGEVLYRAELPLRQAVDIMSWLDGYEGRLIYDCYMEGAGWMTAAQKELIDEHSSSPHYKQMLRQLRRDVPELKEFLRHTGKDVQKIQFFTRHADLRLELMERLPREFDHIVVSSSVVDNVEINQTRANKGEALLALAAHLGLSREQTIALGDGLNDLSMLSAAGQGVAMSNACEEAKAVADWIAPSNDEDGVAAALERYCF